MSLMFRIVVYISLISIYSNGLFTFQNSIAVKRRSFSIISMTSTLESYGIKRTIIQSGSVGNSPAKDDTVEIVWFVI